MTTLGRREKCLRNRSGKGHLQALRAHQMRNRSLPGASGSTVAQNQLKFCRARPFGLYGKIGSGSQNGNSGLFGKVLPRSGGARIRRRRWSVDTGPQE